MFGLKAARDWSLKTAIAWSLNATHVAQLNTCLLFQCIVFGLKATHVWSLNTQHMFGQSMYYGVTCEPVWARMRDLSKQHMSGVSNQHTSDPSRQRAAGLQGQHCSPAPQDSTCTDPLRQHISGLHNMAQVS